MDFPEIVPPVSTPLIVDIGLPFDPVREWPACITRVVGTLYDGDGVRAVLLHAEEFFPMARLDCIRYGGMVAEKLLCVTDDLPEVTVSTVLKNSDEFIWDSFRRIGLG